MKVTCVLDGCLGCKDKIRVVSSTAAMTKTTASGCVEYKAVQGVEKDPRPLIGRTLSRRSDWLN